MNRPLLKITQLSKSYKTNVVLKNIDIAIDHNDCVGLVGINGAGKSTLIKSVLDFISIDSGQIEIEGVSHRDISSRDKISFLPEQFLPPFYLTGWHFLSYMADLNQIELNETEVVEIFNVLDLDLSVLNKPVRHYSKGMAQKLGLAACFLSQRILLIFDEPMSGLDPKARVLTKRYLSSLKENGKTFFFSTHLLNDVEHLCNRVVILHNGQIGFNGSPMECCEKYSKVNLEAAYLACIGIDVSSV